jgi:hypothetical protein
LECEKNREGFMTELSAPVCKGSLSWVTGDAVYELRLWFVGARISNR